MMWQTLTKRIAGLALTALLLPGPATAAPSASPTDCPSTVVTEQSGTSQEGWEAGRAKRTATFSSIDLSDGHPREMAFLAPDATQFMGEMSRNTWNVHPDKVRGLWLSCHYMNTDVVLIRRLPDTVRTCYADYMRKDDVQDFLWSLKCVP